MGEKGGQKAERRGLLAYLEEIPDPRRPQGRIHPLSGLLGMLILAALNGETSLRGMWVWGRAHWERIKGELGFVEWRSPPQYGTLWNLLSKLSLEALWGALQRWGEEAGVKVEVVDVDGKVLRGSKRRSGLPAVQGMGAAAQGGGGGLDATGIEGGDAIEAAIRLLQGLPLEGKVVTLDAGLNHPRVVETVLEKRGPAWEH